jgi:hypothetical protein
LEEYWIKTRKIELDQNEKFARYYRSYVNLRWVCGSDNRRGTDEQKKNTHGSSRASSVPQHFIFCLAQVVAEDHLLQPHEQVGSCK